MGGVLLLAMVACNAPVAGEGTLPTQAARTDTPTVGAASDATPSAPATGESSPDGTPGPDAESREPDPLAVLDTYPSLVTVRQRLDDIVATQRADGTVTSGRQLLEWILVDQQYNPAEGYHLNEGLFAAFDSYSFPHPGARIYLVNVATGLYAEAHRLYPWSLRDYSPQEIDSLFVEDGSLRVTDPALHRGDLPPDMPNLRTHTYPMDVKVVEDAHYKQFNLGRSLIRGATTQEEAVALIVVWMQQSFFHAVEGYGWEVYLDGREPRDDGGPVAYPLSIERIYEERVIGCHEPTILLEGMLHSLNIPAVRLSVHGHGVLYLPTLDRYVHGDHVANYTDAPLGVLLLTPEEFRPFAEDVNWIYQIYLDKYRSPLLSVPLKRDGDYLYIATQNLRTYPDRTCIQVGDEDWARLSQQLATYNIRYDAQECELTSDRVPILTLDELTDVSAESSRPNLGKSTQSR